MLCATAARVVVGILLGGSLPAPYLGPLCASAASTYVTYTYDALNRLTTASFSNGRRISYQYDRAGNRLHKAVTSQLLLEYGPVLPTATVVIPEQDDIPLL